MSLFDLTATEALGGMAAGDFSALEYAEALARHAEKMGHINALINFDPSPFLASAKAADERRRKGNAPPLGGLPFVVKDNIDVVGFATTANTPALANHRPKTQGPVIQSLADAGAIVMAKANLHELAMGPGIGRPPDGEAVVYGAFGPALNPHDPTVTAGGSSSGTGAAIAARLAPVGLGTDTGGSVRKPAAFCGTAGFRPTQGRYGQAGVVPISHTRDTIGILARSVADIALFDACIAGGSPLAPVPLKGLRLGVCRDHYFSGADPRIAAVIEGELQRLAGLGVERVEMELPGLEEALAGPRRAIAMYECLPNLARYLADTGIELEDLISGTRTTGLLEHLRGIQGEKRIAEVDYRKAVEEQRPALQGLLREAFKIHRIAALVLPATLVPPGKRDAEITIERKGETLGRFAAEGHNTGLSSSAGIPTVTVPAGLTEDGLPVGLAFDGPEGGDRDLLALALAYERSRPPPPAPVMLGGE